MKFGINRLTSIYNFYPFDLYIYVSVIEVYFKCICISVHIIFTLIKAIHLYYFPTMIHFIDTICIICIPTCTHYETYPVNSQYPT